MVLMILGPTIWVQILGHEKAIFPYEYPALFSISVAFLGIWLFSATDNSAEGARERELFRAQFIRSQTGFGVEQARAHQSLPFPGRLIGEFLQNIILATSGETNTINTPESIMTRLATTPSC